MRVSLKLNNHNISFKRFYSNNEEKIKQYDLNRNKSLDLIFDKKGLEFISLIQQERNKGFTKDFRPMIKRNMGEVCFDFNNNIVEYDTFNYPKILRGIGQSELNALKEGKQIYSNRREKYFGVDVTNYPNGINYGQYLVHFKLKPNLDHYISDIYRREFAKENVPYIGGWGTGGTPFSHHSLLCGTYTLNDVEKITKLDTNEIVYSQNDERIPDYQELLKNTRSTDVDVVVDAVEKLQTYYGDGFFMDEISFLLDSKYPQIQASYINAFYNYGKNRNLNEILNFEKKNPVLDNIVISRIANCVEKYGEKKQCDDVIKSLVRKVCNNEKDENTIFAFRNIEDAMFQVGFDKLNGGAILKKYLFQDVSIPLKAIALQSLASLGDFDKDIEKYVSYLIQKFDFIIEKDPKTDSLVDEVLENTPDYSPEEVFLKDAIAFYNRTAFFYN